MSSTKRSIYELDLLDDFLFTEASMDKQTSDLLIRLIVERALGVKIGKLINEKYKKSTTYPFIIRSTIFPMAPAVSMAKIIRRGTYLVSRGILW